MRIPDRLRPPPITPEEMAEYTELCRRIENGRHSDDDLDAWNRRARLVFDRTQNCAGRSLRETAGANEQHEGQALESHSNFHNSSTSG